MPLRQTFCVRPQRCSFVSVALHTVNKSVREIQTIEDGSSHINTKGEYVWSPTL